MRYAEAMNNNGTAAWTALVNAAIEDGRETAAKITARYPTQEEAREMASRFASMATGDGLGAHSAAAVASDLIRYADEMDAVAARLDALLA